MKRRQRLDQIHHHPAFATVERVLVALTDAGHQAVLAGGSIRDALLDRPIKDFDVATSAPPEVVEGLFSSTLDVGKAFGTIVVIENGYQFEVTTFRMDSDYSDGRRPTSVQFSSMEEDAKRRDFTVNAFFYDPQEFLLYDFVGGLADLEGRLLRTVGLAEERFQEDHLRMLRAIRFVAQLGFSIDEEVLAAIRKLGEKLQQISAERILNELQRMLVSSHLQAGLQLLRKTELYKYCWPELSSLDPTELNSFLSFMSWENAFAALSLLMEKDPKARLQTLKASRDSQKRIESEIRGAREILNPKSTRAERILALGAPHFAETLVLVSGLLQLRGEKGRIDTWIAEYLEVADPSGELPKAFLSGDDLLQMGIQPSPQMGDILKKVYTAQLESQIVNKDQAIEMVKSFKI